MIFTFLLIRILALNQVRLTGGENIGPTNSTFYTLLTINKYLRIDPLWTFYS